MLMSKAVVRVFFIIAGITPRPWRGCVSEDGRQKGARIVQAGVQICEAAHRAARRRPRTHGLLFGARSQFLDDIGVARRQRLLALVQSIQRIMLLQIFDGGRRGRNLRSGRRTLGQPFVSLGLVGGQPLRRVPSANETYNKLKI